MAERKDGGSAFPRSEFIEDLGNGNQVVHNSPGMSLRDWFAGQALAGMLVNGRTLVKFSDYAKEAYRYADAMLDKRERG